MYESNEENAARVEAAVAVLREHGRGDTVPHEVIGRAIGLRPSDDRSSPYYRLAMQARNRLRDEDGITSTPVVGVGFRLLTVHQTLTEEQARRTKRARRQVRLARKSASTLPVDSLTFHQRQLREAVIRSAATKEKALADREAAAKEFAAPFKGLPFHKPAAGAAQRASVRTQA